MVNKTHFETLQDLPDICNTILEDGRRILEDPGLPANYHNSFVLAKQHGGEYDKHKKELDKIHIRLAKKGNPMHLKTQNIHHSHITKSLCFCMHIYMHYKEKQKVYDVSPGLAEQLFHTDLRGLTADDLRLPFPNIYIKIPRFVLTDINDDPSDKRDVICGVYVTEDLPVKGVKDSHDLHFMFIGYDREKGEQPDVVGAFALTLNDGTGLEQALKDLSRHRASTHLILLFKWVCNVILYSTSSEISENIIANKEARLLWQRIEKMPKGVKRKALISKARSIKKMERVVLGGHIKVCRDDGTPYKENTFNAQTRTMHVRCKVAGHWRHYWIGEGRTTRIRKRIEPFWRGPELGEIVQKQYLLDSKSPDRE